MATNPMSELIDLVNSEASRLGEFLSHLDEASWSQDSACEGWKVGDVVGHLASGGATWANSITRSINGDAGPPEGGAFLQPGERGSSAIAQAAIAIHQEMGTKLLDNFSEGYDHLRQVMAGLKAEDFSPSTVLLGSPFDVFGANLDQVSEVLFVKGPIQIRLNPVRQGTAQLTVPLPADGVEPAEYSLLLRTIEGDLIATGLTIVAESAIPSPTDTPKPSPTDTPKPPPTDTPPPPPTDTLKPSPTYTPAPSPTPTSPLPTHTPNPAGPRVGDRAPEFALTGWDGEIYPLGLSLAGHRSLVLVFYRGHW